MNKNIVTLASHAELFIVSRTKNFTSKSMNVFQFVNQLYLRKPIYFC